MVWDSPFMSKKAKEILSDRKVAWAISLAIANHGVDLDRDGFLAIPGTNITVWLASELAARENNRVEK